MKVRLLALILCLPLLLSGCSFSSEDATEPHSVSFNAMDTYATITAYGKKAESALSAAQKRFLELEKMWSVTDEASDIYAANHSGGGAVTVSDETAALLDFTLQMSTKTGGALDPTIYPVLTAWGFTTEQYRIPSEEEIDALLENVGYENVSLEGKTIQLEEGMMIDLGAVGKGYAGDIISDLLRKNGITSALLNLGGNVQTIGTKPDGSKWRIGLQDPNGEGTIGVMEASDVAVITSGCYERYFIGSDGKKYGHIIDPKTGHPVDNGMLSVTIIAEEGRLCDSLSTSLFVMGLEGAAEYWRQNQDFEAIFMTSDNTLYLTEGLADNFMLYNDYGYLTVRVIVR